MNTNNLNSNLKQFALTNGFDVDTLNNLLSGKTKGNRKGTKAYNLKKFLLANNLFIDTNTKDDIDIDVSCIKDTLLRDFWIIKLKLKINSTTTLKDLAQYVHKKLPGILDVYFDRTVKDYIDNTSYFKSKNIISQDIQQFCHGSTDGSRKGTKAYYIKQKFIADGIMPKITIKK